MWIGTNNNGLNSFHPGRMAFNNYSHDPSNPASLVDNNISCIFIDRAGAAWIGTQGGLDCLNRSAGTFRHYKHDPSNPKSIGEIPNCIYEDRSGILWVGTLSNGLDRFDRKTGQFSHYRHEVEKPGSLSDNSVYTILEDHTGVLWVGTYNRGLDGFDRKTETFRVFTHRDSIKTSLSAVSIWALCEDHTGILWVGTYGGGLNRFNRERETFVSYKNQAGNPASLSENNVLCIHEDRSGTLWIGTTGGLNRFEPAAGTFKRYREKDGLPNDYVLGILEDDHGNLWLSTNKGLSRFDPRTGMFRNYDATDGLPANEFNQNASGKSAATGEMYFGGGNGFTVFHPDSVKENSFVPPVVFSGFRRYNTDDQEGKPIEEKGIAARDHLNLTYKDNIISFDFAALNYLNAFKNQYAYKLEGFSDNWIQLGRERRATFTNLDAGEYTLRVKGSNDDGVWNEQGASMKISIAPPWWRSRLAYVFYVLAVISGAVTADRMRRRRLIAAAENERKTRELEDARRLQLSMLPKEIPQLAHVEIAVYMKTATEVGGDYYDFHEAGDGTLTVAIGDATGHGLKSGTVVTATKTLFEAIATDPDIPGMFNYANKVFRSMNLRQLYMALTILKIRDSRALLCAAGMPPVLIHRAAGHRIEEHTIKGMPLGSVPNFPYEVREINLSPGDALILMSDGFPELFNEEGEQFGYDKPERLLRESGSSSPQDIIRHFVQAGEQWAGKKAQDDDITFVVLKMKEK